MAKAPDNVAVVFEKDQLTYAELNAKANQLARYLQSLGEPSGLNCTFKLDSRLRGSDRLVIAAKAAIQEAQFNSEPLLTHSKPDSFIALCLDKSLEMIIGILGILKSGAAYVPIDPNYPDERIKYILEDTKAACVLTQSHYLSKLQTLTNAQLVAVNNNCYQDLSTDNLPPQSTSHDLAYVMYTSGTTGQPKGVCIEHHSIINLVITEQEKLGIDYKSKMLQFSSLSFDASVWEIFGALSFGSQLNILLDTKKSQPKYLQKYLSVNKISHATLPPKIIENLTTTYLPKYLCSAGESLSIKAFQELIKRQHFVNAYGPTETTVCATMHHYHSNRLAKNIGRPINNTKCYVIDKHNNPVPVGVIGELHIGGAGLARGYLNQPELTAKKFIANPFATEEDKHHGYDRLYKTGDLVRWLPDGNLEYIGRKDTQVKLRGFRIELSEIENALTQINGIKQAVVINRAINDEPYLFAYYIAHDQINPQSILDQLTQKLPHYMLPAAALQIDNIPLTLNGKIDIHALPLISFQSAQVYIEPRTEQERIVCQAFSHVLLIEKIGIDDDFFKLGGNSIKAIQLAMILQANFDIAVSELFELRTPRKLAENRKITHGLLIDKLKQIKHNYANYVDKPLDSAILRKKERYLAEVASMPTIPYTTKPIKNVLLTGATGFLGCNLLHQLLRSTSYRIYLCVRAKDKLHAIERMAHKYQFYFDLSLEDHFGDRVVYIPCDLEKERIGLADNDYKQLAQTIDSIIHCAALAKHYGIEQVFYNANVKSTIHLLKLCELTNLKDFHYISTYSVMAGVAQDNETLFTEDDQLNENAQWNSPYNKTKYLGEINAIKWRKKGINSNVYRVGNLACMQNGKVQEDVADNSFANYVKFVSKLGCIANIMDKVEISPVDITAQAMVKLFDKAELNNQTFHVFNPHLVRLSELLEADGSSVATVSFENFIDRLICYLQHNGDCALIRRFLLRMGWQENQELTRKFDLLILQDKTAKILQSLKFTWQKALVLWLNNPYFKYIDNMEICTNE